MKKSVIHSIPSVVLRQIPSILQSEFSTDYDLVLTFSEVHIFKCITDMSDKFLANSQHCRIRVSKFYFC